jgi:hypothetical protein
MNVRATCLRQLKFPGTKPDRQMRHVCIVSLPLAERVNHDPVARPGRLCVGTSRVIL